MATAGCLSIPPILSRTISEDVSDALVTLNTFLPADAAIQDNLWQRIAQSFTTTHDMIDLNNAGVSPQPKIVQDAISQYNQASNRGPSYYLWNVANKNREVVKKHLAELAGTSDTLIAMNRNTTEALGTVTWGISLHEGDEVVMSRLDYPNMIHAWKQKELREKIKIRWIDLSLPIEDEETIVKLFTDATTPQTKVWHITHMINWTGQILPVKRLCAEARKRNVISIIDGAQSLAHLDFRIDDVNPDYFGASLHKWLCAPYGHGMLYVKQENIEGLWPLFPNGVTNSNDIRKFESIGTRPFTSELAIAQAIEFHNMIGGKRKEERLRYLKNYCFGKIAKYPRAQLHTSLNPDFSCGVGCLSIDGIPAEELRTKLFSKFKIIATSVKIENLEGLRVSPNIYTAIEDLDRFAEAVLEICQM
jgi:selenocysteine lyase/cysteine desulfurase